MEGGTEEVAMMAVSTSNHAIDGVARDIEEVELGEFSVWGADHIDVAEVVGHGCSQDKRERERERLEEERGR